MLLTVSSFGYDSLPYSFCSQKCFFSGELFLWVDSLQSMNVNGRRKDSDYALCFLHQVQAAIRSSGGSKAAVSESVEASVIYVRFKAAASEVNISFLPSFLSLRQSCHVHRRRVKKSSKIIMRPCYYCPSLSSSINNSLDDFQLFNFMSVGDYISISLDVLTPKLHQLITHWLGFTGIQFDVENAITRRVSTQLPWLEVLMLTTRCRKCMCLKIKLDLNEIIWRGSQDIGFFTK